MAKVGNPLFSFGASGTVANLLTFNQSSRAPVVRRKPTGYQPATAPQQHFRDKCRDAAATWRALPAIEQQEWKTIAALSGRQVFAKYLLEWIAQHSTTATPPFIPMR